MELGYNRRIYLITFLYAIGLIPLYFILFKIPIPYLQPWMVFIFPLILPICLITKKKIRDKVKECDDLYLNSIKDQKLKELYAEDAKIWYEKTFVKKGNKIVNLSLMLGFLVIPTLTRFISSTKFEINLTIIEFIYFIVFGLSLIAILIYASYHFFFLFQISSIVHHYSFWETNHQQDKNPLGELFILNIFSYLLLDSVFVTYLTPLLISMMVYFISGTNPKINYLKNITPNFLKYKKATPYVIIFANSMYILKWFHKSFSSIDISLFLFGILIFFIFRKYWQDVLTGQYADYQKATASFLETFAHEKIQIPYYLAVTLLSLLPFVFSILTTSLWNWDFTIFIIFTIFCIISGYIGISFLRFEKNRNILLKFKKVFFSIIVTNSCIPLGFYIFDAIFFSTLQILPIVVVIFFTILNLIFGAQFYRSKVNTRFAQLFCFSIITVSLIPTLQFIIEFYFVKPQTILFWNLWETLLLTGLGIIFMFLGIGYLRKKTSSIMDKFYPYIPNFKKEETNFHFWATFNSNHTFYFSIFFGFAFFLFSIGWRLINLFEIPIEFNNTYLFSINLFGSNLNINYFLWISGNYLGLYIYGIGFGFLVWLLFNATHDIWHSITLSEGVPLEIQNDLYSSKKIFFQTAVMVFLILGSSSIWFIGDMLIKTSYFQILFRLSTLIIMGSITLLGLIYIIRNEINRKRYQKKL